MTESKNAFYSVIFFQCFHFWTLLSNFFLLHFLSVRSNKNMYHEDIWATWLYKWDSATEFIKLGSTPFKDGATLAPKLINPLFHLEKRLHPFLYWIRYSWSGSTIILKYINLSVSWNTLLRNQILVCQCVFYYIWIKE